MRDSVIQFPNEFIDPFEKDKKPYCLQFTKAFDGSSGNGLESSLFKNKQSTYEKNRKLANGKQDPNQYMKQVGVKGGKNGKSWKALDTSILPVAPKFVEQLIGKVISKGYDAKGFRKTIIKGIDRKSAEEEKGYKAGMAEQVINKDFVAGLNQKGIDMPLNGDGAPVPDQLQEVDTYSELFRKDEYAIEAKDAMITWFDSNNMEQLMFEVIDGLVKDGDAGIVCDLDQNGNIKLRRMIVDRVISNHCRHKDFRDLNKVGEYIEVTISELREMWPGQPEKVYKDAAEKSTNKEYGNDFLSSYYDTNMGYPYDKDKITILHARWLSTDKWTHLKTKDNFGKNKLVKKPYNFPTNRKGVEIPLDDYKKKHPNKEVIKTELQNVYQCKWIVGTDYAFDFGLINNIQRTKNSLYGANLGFHLYHMTNNIIEKIQGIINMCQVAWLQHQNLVARIRPNGMSIEMSAVEGMSAGKNKDKMGMKDLIRLYFDTGLMFWRRKNHSNASNQFNPISELKNNSSDDIERSLGLIFTYIDLLRNILGINEVEDASTPNPEILKGVAEMAAIGTKHALKDLYQGAKSIYERTAKSVIDLTPDAREISKHKGFENALGARSDQFWKELGLREMGVIIEEGPDIAQKQTLENAINKSVDAQVITPDEGAEFLNDDNLVRAAQQLKDKIRKNRKEAEESQMRLREQESQQSIAVNEAAAKTRSAELQAEYEAKKDFKSHETIEEMRLEALKHQNRMKEIAMEKGFDLEAQDDQQDHELDLKQLDIEGKVEVEKAKPKPTVAAPVSK